MRLVNRFTALFRVQLVQRRNGSRLSIGRHGSFSCLAVSELVLDGAAFLLGFIPIQVEQVHGHVVFETMKIFAKLNGVGAARKVGFFGRRDQLLFVALLHDHLRQYNFSNDSDSWLRA